MRRFAPRLAALALALAAPGCTEDRPRPSPVGPDAEARLTVQVVSPATNTTVLTGRPVSVDVVARDLNRLFLTGFGFVARRVQGAELIDSVVVMFETPRAVARDTFVFTVPAAYPTNTQVDIHGLAFGPRGASRISAASSVVVVQCRPDLPGCQ
jgi:hypothetical protein